MFCLFEGHGLDNCGWHHSTLLSSVSLDAMAVMIATTTYFPKWSIMLSFVADTTGIMQANTNLTLTPVDLVHLMALESVLVPVDQKP